MNGPPTIQVLWGGVGLQYVLNLRKAVGSCQNVLLCQDGSPAQVVEGLGGERVPDLDLDHPGVGPIRVTSSMNYLRCWPQFSEKKDKEIQSFVRKGQFPVSQGRMKKRNKQAIS